MKNYIILLFYIIAYGNIFSQSCDGFDKNNFISTINVWNWRDPSDANWTAKIDYGQGNPIIRSIGSPFEPSNIGQPNTQHLWLAQNTRDYDPAEGWELVYKDFGFNSTNGLANPHFILYNRFRSVMRVFYCITKQQTLLTSSKISLDWNPGKISTLFESGKSSMFSNANFDKSIIIDIPNKMPINEAFVWQYAEVPVNYDPCTCSASPNNLNVVTPNVSSFNFGVYFYSNSISKFEINQVIQDSTNVMIAGDYVRQNNSDILTQLSFAGNYLFGRISTGFTRGNKLEKSINETLNSITKGYGSMVDISNFLNKRDSATFTSKNVKLPTLFKQLPYIGTAFGFLEGFFGGGKTNDVDNTTNSAVPLRFAMTGTTTVLGSLSGKSIYTPGSPHSTIIGQNVVKPSYNYVMGIFALLEEPKLEAVTHFLEPNVNNSSSIIPPRITKYRLKEPLKYAINPASELEVIDLQTALEYQLLPNRENNVVILRPIDTSHKKILPVSNASGQLFNLTLPLVGPVFTKPARVGASYKEICEHNGVFIANWPKQNKIGNDPFQASSLYNITYSTGFFNPICAKNYSFAIADRRKRIPNSTLFINICTGASQVLYPMDDYTDYLDFTENNLKITLKVKAIFRRKDSNASNTTEDIVRLFSYDVKTPKPYDNIAELGYSNNFLPYYRLNLSNCGLYNGRYGVDYYVEWFSPLINGGIGTMPLGTVNYKDTLIITSWIPPLNDSTLFANKVIIVKAPVYSNNGTKVILRAGNAIIVDVNGSIDPASVTQELSSDMPGCEEVLPSVNYNFIQSYCTDKNRYNPNYSKMILNQSKIENSTSSISLHPNPTSSKTTLTLSGYENTSVSVMIFDLVGREVYTQLEKDITAREHQAVLNTETLQAGTYIVKVFNGTEEKIAKLVILKN
jgi:hypothetical protein